MKTITTSIAIALLVTSSFGQTTQSFNIQNSPFGSTTEFQKTDVQTQQESSVLTANNLFELKSSLTTNEDPINYDEYGGKFSLGVALGGGGIAGGVFRYYPRKMIAIEAGAFYRPIFYESTTSSSYGPSSSSIEYLHGLMIAGGISAFVSENYVSYKNKIIKNGLMIKAGINPSSKVAEKMFVIGWSRQAMKKSNKKYAYFFELGAGVIIQDIKSNTTTYRWDNEGYNRYIVPSTSRSIVPLIYWKCHWSRFFS